MKYPCLVLDTFCQTDITVEVEQEGLNEYGEPLETFTYEGKCNYQDKSKTVLTADKKLVEVTGSALFPGDIAPQLPTLSGGTVTVYGEKRHIVQGTKGRNPDGTVNFTRLEVQ